MQPLSIDENNFMVKHYCKYCSRIVVEMLNREKNVVFVDNIGKRKDCDYEARG